MLNILTGLEIVKAQVTQHSANDASLYIPLQATTSTADNTQRFDLQQEMLQFFNLAQNVERQNDAKVLLLLGDTGSGKSMFAENFYQHLWQQYEPGQAIPLWLPLPELQNPFGEAVEEVLLSFGFDKAQVAELKSQHQFIIIADGYDELHSWQNIYMSNHLAEWNAKVIVTCRSQAVYHIRDFEKYFTPYQDDQPLRHLLTKYFVAPFSENQIDLYLNQCQRQQQPVTNHNDDDNDDDNRPILTQAQLRAVPGLSDLITTPFLLHLAVETLPDILIRFQNSEITQQAKLTLAALYDVFIERWFNRQVIKLLATKQISADDDFKPKLWQFCQSLASKMHQKNITHLPYTNAAATAKKSLFGKSKTEPANPWATFFSAENSVLRSGCPLRQYGENTYGFVHASFVEYFAMRAMYVESLPSSREPTVNATPITATTATAVSSSSNIAVAPSEKPSTLKEGIHYRLFTQEPNAIRMLADRVFQYPAFKAKLFEHIERSKTDARYAIGAANAITALNSAEITFAGMDFKNIKIAHANLQNAMMDHANLSGTDLTGVNFKNASLVQTNLSDAKLTDLDFEEQAYIEAGDQVWGIQISADGRLLAITTGSTIKLWDRESNQFTHTLQGESDSDFMNFCLSPDGSTLVSVSSEDKSIRLWATATGQIIGMPINIPKNAIPRLAISPNSEVLAYTTYTEEEDANQHVIQLWDMTMQSNRGNTISTNEISYANCLTFSPNGALLACGNSHPNLARQGSIQLFSTHSYQSLNLPFQGHKTSVNCLAFSTNGALLISGSDDKSIRIWDVDTGEAVRVISDAHSEPISSLTISPEGNSFATGSRARHICLWQLSSGALLGEPINGHTESVTSLAFTNDSKILLSGSTDKTVRQWNIKTEQPKLTENMICHTGRITCVTSTIDGKWLASASDDSTIILWDSETGRALGEPLKGHNLTINSITFSPHGNKLASGSVDLTVCVWDTHTQILLGQPLQGHYGQITAVRFSPDGLKLASASLDKNIIIRDAITTRILSTLKGHTETITSITFSPDSECLLSGGWDHSLRLWNITTGHCITTLITSNNINGVTWSLDGRILAASWSGTALGVWEKTTELLYSEIFTSHSEAITSVAFSPDSKLVATGSLDKNIRVSSLTDISKLSFKPLLGHTATVTSVTFVSNEKLLSGSQDYSLRLWQYREINNEGKIWLTVWRSRPYVLQVLSAELSGARDFSPVNRALLEQHNIKKIEQREATPPTVHLNNNPSRATPLYTTLLDAAKNGAIEQVQHLLDIKVNIHQTDKEGKTALTHACDKGYVQIIQLLLRAGANVNQTEKNGWTLLHAAAYWGRSETVALLINAGANVDQILKDGSTPFLFAANMGQVECAALLINAKANVNKARKNGESPLYCAAQYGYSEVVALLINAHADVNQVGKSGETPLYVAAGNGHTETVQLLINAKANINHANKKGDTPLYHAVKWDRTETVACLLKAHAEVNQAELLFGETPLYVAVENSHIAIVKLLLNAKADVNHAKHTGATPLSLAVEKGEIEIIELLRTKCDSKSTTTASSSTVIAWERAQPANNSPLSTMSVFLAENKKDQQSSSTNNNEAAANQNDLMDKISDDGARREI